MINYRQQMYTYKQGIRAINKAFFKMQPYTYPQNVAAFSIIYIDGTAEHS